MELVTRSFLPSKLLLILHFYRSIVFSSESRETLPTVRRRASSGSEPVTMLEAILLPNVLAVIPPCLTIYFYFSIAFVTRALNL